MLDSVLKIEDLRGMDLLTSFDTMKVLGVTRVTLYKWVEDGLIKAKKIPIGGRNYLVFDGKEVNRVKAKMQKKLTQGKSWFKEAPHDR